MDFLKTPDSVKYGVPRVVTPENLPMLLAMSDQEADKYIEDYYSKYRDEIHLYYLKLSVFTYTLAFLTFVMQLLFVVYVITMPTNYPLFILFSITIFLVLWKFWKGK